MTTFAEEWASYVADALHPSATPIQLRETQMAFYGGAISAVHLITKASELSPVEQRAAIEAIMAELEAYSEAVAPTQGLNS